MVAKNVEGSTGVKEMPQFPAEPAPEIAGSGANVGKVRTWNDTKGYGFIDLPGQPNVWLHVKECINTQPQQGDWVRFDVQPSETKPGQMVAKNVTGGSQPLGQRGYGPVSNGGAGTVAAAGYSPYGVTGLTAGALQGVAGYAVQVQQPALTALPGGGYVLQQSLPVQAVPQQGLQQGLYGVAGMQQYAIQQPGMQQLQQFAVQPGLQQFAVQPGMQQFAVQQPGVQQLLQPGMQQYLMQQPLMQQQTLLQQPVGLQDAAAAGLPVMADPSQAALQIGMAQAMPGAGAVAGAIEATIEAQPPPVPPPPEPPLGGVPQEALPAAPPAPAPEHAEQAVQPGEPALPPAPAPQEAPGDASVAAQLAAVVGSPPPPPPADAATPQ
ncbi:unnamed protein product [Symbiodinium sp. CCMP2456]|nr:unnamed protein product [Symbiodinium sp. CCMP2456]